MTLPSLTRRTFLKTVVVAAGTISVTHLVGCNDGNSSSSSTEISVNTALFPQSIASGDPKANSIVLWTRLYDANQVDDDLTLRLQVASDEGFSTLVVDSNFTALAAHDHCIKVKVTGLQPYTTYYYRFVYKNSSSTKTGHAKTAAAADSDIAVKFGFVSCQDYIGRYYNSYAKFLDDDLDFFVHLGDYVYETTGDPSFQNTDSDRTVVFSDQAGAIEIGEAGETYYSAASLDNYRDLYRTYRSDPMLQEVHENLPIIPIWDDHEFSDDCWGANATITSGKQNEESIARRQVAERVWLEYMPVDLNEVDSTEVVPINGNRLYPNNRIYRDFQFGQHLHLLMTDYRSYRPDHLIPEDAYPATIVIDSVTLASLLGALGLDVTATLNLMAPYINVDEEQYARLKEVLLSVTAQAYQAEGLSLSEAQERAENVIQGNLDATVINATLESYNAAAPEAWQVAPFTDEQLVAMERGLSYLFMGKQSLFSSLGSRYFLIKSTYDLFATYQYLFGSQDAGLNAYGQTQETWLKGNLQNSSATWRVLADSVSFTSLILDFTDTEGLPADAAALLDAFPTTLRNAFYLNADHWDGFQPKRQELLKFIDAVPNTLMIAGDIHAAYVSQHETQTVEFTGMAVSSGTFADLGAEQIAELGIPGGESLTPLLDQFLMRANSNIKYANSFVHGVAIVSINAEQAEVTYHMLPADTVNTSYYDDRATLNDLFQSNTFTVANGQLSTEV